MFSNKSKTLQYKFFIFTTGGIYIYIFIYLRHVHEPREPPMCMARNCYSTSKYKWIWRIMENSKPEKDNMRGNIPSCRQLGPSGRSNRGWRRQAIPGRENSKRLSRSRARFPGRLVVLVGDPVRCGTQQCNRTSWYENKAEWHLFLGVTRADKTVDAQ